jgi:hypothetical protein
MDTGACCMGLKLDGEVVLLLGDCVFDDTRIGNCEGLRELSIPAEMLGIVVASTCGATVGVEVTLRLGFIVSWAEENVGIELGKLMSAGESLLASSSLINSMEGDKVRFNRILVIEGSIEYGILTDGLRLDCSMGSMLGNEDFNVTGTDNCEGVEEISILVGIVLGASEAIITGSTG